MSRCIVVSWEKLKIDWGETMYMYLKSITQPCLIVKATYLEKPKRIIIWNGGNM